MISMVSWKRPTSETIELSYTITWINFIFSVINTAALVIIVAKLI